MSAADASLYLAVRALQSDISLPRAGNSYLAYVSLMNQMVMMATQVYHDACMPEHHKYMAHQMALLYVSWFADLYLGPSLSLSLHQPPLPI